MKICKVIGHVWATKKEESLEGIKMMIVQPCTNGSERAECFVAGDTVGAGIGEKVLVLTGSSAKGAFPGKQCNIDGAIVGIVDAMEIPDSD